MSATRSAAPLDKATPAKGNGVEEAAFRQTKKALVGHSDSVLSLCIHPNGTTVYSGSEDGTVKEWDLNAPLENNSTLKCSRTINMPEKAAASSVKLLPTDPTVIFVAAGSSVYNFDLKASDDKLSTYLQKYSHNDDDISQIDLSKNGRYIAAADDNNEVKIIEVATNKLWRTLRKHTNLCSAVLFRNSAQNTEVVSAGFDCNIFHLECTKATIHTSFNLFDPSTAGPQIVNPPYIHSLDLTEDGNYLLAAVGDGSLQLFHLYLKDRLGIVERANESATTFAGFASFGAPYSRVISGGNDETLSLWTVAYPPPGDLKTYLQYKRAAQVTANAKRSKNKGQNKQSAVPSPPPEATFQLDLKLKIGKINFIATTKTPTACGNTFIANETNDILAFLVPSSS